MGLSVPPSLFVSHGAPSMMLEPSPTRAFLQTLPALLPTRPKAILIVSAHWQAPVSMLNGLGAHRTIHDFGGFPEALYAMHYPAPGAPGLVERARVLLGEQGVQVVVDAQRGLDHGAWVPLLLGWPAADIPVAQLALVAGAGAGVHMALGRALAPLRREGVLVIGSGSFTHNLREWMVGAGRGAGVSSPSPGWVAEFADWMHEHLDRADLAALGDYRERAPFARRNHPTDEHLMPLFVALGAAGERPTAIRLHQSAEHGVMRMDAYRFDG
ncbi:DODA-type extradiol aromatic ring-opening family dioxygenase [Sphingomonas fennica]|uniref:Dioxygenase n=1 Tax=Edaphosphingomonas fennica TaxID=114404 RepID=A0A2T4HLV5_9SPHN|nr:class III extradiol ring-cleavage dioxygenase [Sphingomonas fennica]PTD16794.1 dioxygenase [Sphingomonas fennica]